MEAGRTEEHVKSSGFFKLFGACCIDYLNGPHTILMGPGNSLNNLKFNNIVEPKLTPKFRNYRINCE